jgi:competence protein ComEC
MHRPLLKPMIAFLSGVLLAGTIGSAFLPGQIKPLAIALALLLFLAAGIVKKGRLFYAAIILFFFLLGVFRYTVSVSPGAADISRYLTSDPVKAVVYGAVITPPEKGKTFYYEYAAFTLRTKKVYLDNKEKEASGDIKVTMFDPGLQTPEIGDDIVISGKLSLFEGRMNPAGPNYREEALRTGIKARLSSSKNDVLFFAPSPKTPVIVLRRGLAAMREKAALVIARYLAPGPRALTESVILGIRNALDPATKNIFAKTGTMHILAVSGLHIGIVAFVIMAVMKLVRAPRGMLCAVTMLGVVLFAVFTGCRPSSMRAAIMAAFLLAGLYLGRKGDILNALALSALAITFFEPGQLFAPGFILSYLAVLSIIYIKPLTDNFFGLSPDNSPSATHNSQLKSRVFRLATGASKMLLSSLSVSLAVTIGMMPVIASYFRIITPSSVIANLIAVPALFVLIVLGAGLVVAGSLPLLAPAAPLIAGLIKRLIFLMAQSLGFLSRIPGSYVRIPAPGLFLTALFYAALFFAIIFSRKKGKGRVYLVIFILFAANFFVWIEASRFAPATTRTTFFSTGKSDASLMEFSDGSVMLIDAGTSGQRKGRDVGSAVIEPYLIQNGIRKIGAVVFTHAHEDHIGGFLSLFENFDVGTVIEAGNTSLAGAERRIYERLDQLAKNGNVSRLEVKKGDILQGLPVKEASILNPKAPAYYGDLNNDSIVMKVVTKEAKSILFAADIAARAMEDVLRFGRHLKSDVLKAPHHGSGLGDRVVVGEFLSLVDPQEVVITNTSVHDVDAAVLESVHSLGAKILVTGETGAVVFQEVTLPNTLPESAKHPPGE